MLAAQHEQQYTSRLESTSFGRHSFRTAQHLNDTPCEWRIIKTPFQLDGTAPESHALWMAHRPDGPSGRQHFDWTIPHLDVTPSGWRIGLMTQDQGLTLT
jgi:hypothetical protein